ncbi:MAG TPA: DUF4394 domain-containing protein [Luteolibacter sp.]|nr:DUF4394 domain-containing protein [Luteolibacter sp.]
MKHPILLTAVSACLAAASSATVLTGVTADNQLVSFDSATPGTFLSSVPISGLADPFASIVNLAYHAGDGNFYGLDTNANFYRISSNGTGTLLNNTFAPNGYSGGLAYDTFTGNLVFGSINAEHFTLTTAGTATANPDFVYGTGDPHVADSPSVFAIGLDPITGEAFFLDNATGTLSQSFDPGLSELFTIGSLGVGVTSFGALTVDEDGNLFASLSTDALSSSLYSIDKTTGAATLIGGFNNGVSALAAIPEPSAALLGGLGALALLRRRRA